MATRSETEVGISANFPRVASKEGIVSSQNQAREEMEIVRKAQNGDEVAFEALYTKYQLRVFWYSLKRLGNRADAEDVTSEVFLKMAENLSRFQIREKPFGAWVFRIAHNTLISLKRAQKSTESETMLAIKPSQDRFSNPEEFVEKQLLIEQIFASVEKLPVYQKKVIIMRFVEGLSVKETAKKLGKGESNVKVRQTKAIINLSAMLNQDGFRDLPDFAKRKPISTTVVERIRRVSAEKLDQLPMQLKKAADLIRSGKTIEEVAQTLDKQVDTVYSHLTLALSRLGQTRARSKAKKVL